MPLGFAGPLLFQPDESTKLYDLEDARKNKVPEDKIFDHFKSTNPNDYDFDKAVKAGVPINKINDYVAGIINDPSGINRGKILKNNLIRTKDESLDSIIPMAGGATMTALTALTKKGAIGFAGATAVTDALQHLYSTDGLAKRRSGLADLVGAKSGGEGEHLANATQSQIVNELMGKVFNKGKEFFKNSGTPIDTPLERLKPTYSQSGDKPRTVASLIENIWGQSDKSKAMAESGKLAKEVGKGIIEGISGKDSSPVQIGDRIQTSAKQSVNELNRRFGDSRKAVEVMGKLNSVEIPGDTNSMLPSGKGVNPFAQPSPSTRIQGPISLDKTVAEAKSVLAENAQRIQRDKFFVPSDNDKRVLAQAETIISEAGNGKPISYKDASSLLHGENGDGGLKSFGEKEIGEVSGIKDSQNRFAKALDSDIENSIGKWNDPGKVARNAFNESKAALLTKEALTSGKSLGTLIQSENPLPQIDKILKDPNEIQRLLNSSNLQGIKSTNMKQDLAGYKLQDIFRSGDGSKMLENWNSPDFTRSKDLLYSKSTQKEIGEFLQNASKVSETGATSQFAKVRMTMHGVAIGGSMLAGLVSGNPTLAGLGTFAALELPAYVIAKILNNPSKAVILNRIVSGRPLEMSEQAAGRMIMSGLNGIRARIVNNEGKSHDVEIKDGQIK